MREKMGLGYKTGEYVKTTVEAGCYYSIIILIVMRKIVYESGVGGFWWLPLLSGLICVGLGLWTLFSPASAMIVLAYTFAVCLVLTGGLNVGLSVALSKITPGWGWSLALGLLELVAGIWLLALPEVTVVSTFVFVAGFFIIVAAINSLCEAFALSFYSGWWVLWSILLLIATIVLAIIFVSNPIGGGVIVWLWIGLSFITFGVYRVTFAFGLRSVMR